MAASTPECKNRFALLCCEVCDCHIFHQLIAWVMLDVFLECAVGADSPC